jgi:hypothetical protein
MATAYDILRNFLNEAVKGTDTDAILYALSTGDDLLASNSQAAVQNMFLATASGEYLDYLSANVGVIRPSNIGISDNSLRNISKVFIGYKNTNNSINDLLKIYFSVYQTNAYVETSNAEDFELADGDNLQIRLDNDLEYDIYFDSDYFNNIATASATEVANYLNNYFLDLQINAVATVFEDIANSQVTVRLLTKTQGSRGSIAIIGGTAQKALNFSDLFDTTQTSTTQFTITQPRNGIFRYTWTGGDDPGLDLVNTDSYVIISGPNFESVNKGSFQIEQVVAGPEDSAYFEIYNVSGTTQSLTLSAGSDLLFYDNVNYKITSRDQYAAIFETSPGSIDLTIPASTSIVERAPLTGGSYITETSYTFTLGGAVSFSIGETVIDNTSLASGVVISVTGTTLVIGDVQTSVSTSFLATGTLYGETSGLSANFSATPTKSSDVSLTGCYLFDLNSYVLTKTSTSLSGSIYTGSNNIILEVASTEDFPDSGYLALDFGMDNEEILVPYIAILNEQQIQLDPSYTFKKNHSNLCDISLLLDNEKYSVSNNGDDLGIYLTDVANARQNFVDNLNKIKSSGIVLNKDILYPNDYGLPNAGTDYSDIIRVYGPDSALDTEGFLELV